MIHSNHFFISSARYRISFICVLILLNVVSSSNAQNAPMDWPTIKEATKDCQIPKIEDFSLYRFTDSFPWSRDFLAKIRMLGCYGVKNKTESPKDIDEKLHHLVVYYAYCRGPTINPSYYEARIKDLPKAYHNVFEQFCRSTYEPYNKFLCPHMTVLKEKVDWLNRELVCQNARHVGHADDWFEVFRPDDSPLLKRLDDFADSICDDLRHGKISAEEARYRLEQEVAWFKERFPKESVGRILDPFWDLLKDLVGESE